MSYISETDLRILRERAEHAERELAATQRDAQRYRWLRDESSGFDGRPFIARYTGSFSRWVGDDADKVVDAAMQEPQP